MKTVNEKINQLILRSLTPHLFTARRHKTHAQLSQLTHHGTTSLRAFFLLFFFLSHSKAASTRRNTHNNAIMRVTSTPFSVILIMKFLPKTHIYIHACERRTKKMTKKKFEINNSVAVSIVISFHFFGNDFYQFWAFVH